MKDNVEKWIKDAVDRNFGNPNRFRDKLMHKHLSPKQKLYYKKLREEGGFDKKEALKLAITNSLQ